MIGLALGVVVMIVVLSVMNGFDHEMRTRVLGMVPHATIVGDQPISDWQSLAAKVEQNPKVAAVAPYTQMQGLLTHDGNVQKCCSMPSIPRKSARCRSLTSSCCTVSSTP